MEGVYVRNNQNRSFVPLYFQSDGYWYEYCGRKNTVYSTGTPPVFEYVGPKLLIKW